MRNPISILPLLAVVFLSRSTLPAVTVTSTADAGPGSLRAAILAATPGDTINFSVSGAITLTTGELLIDKDLVIVGPGAANLTVQRSAANGISDFRVFNINAGVVTISGLTIMNGRDSTGAGLNNSSTLTMYDCVLTGNSATASGGAINNSSTLSASNCVVQRNSVIAPAGTPALGGGVYSDGTMTALNCNISNNSASGGSETNGLGGGIYNNGTMALTNSVVDRNLATGGADGDGGGIFNGGTITLNATTVDSNQAAGNAGNNAGSAAGGGIANDFGTVIVDRSTISGNAALCGQAGLAQGGGIANVLGTVVMDNSTLSGNIARAAASGTALVQGGGLFNGQGSVTVTHSTLTANDPAAIMNSDGVVETGNSIIAGNMTLDLFTLQPTDIQSDGFNLIGFSNVAIPAGPGDRFNITSQALHIGLLQNNDGPTFTHALLCGSPAIDSGDNTGAPATDQRGFTRIVGGKIDIGSFEYNNSPPSLACLATTPLCTSSNTAQAFVSINITHAGGGTLTVLWSVDGVVVLTNQVASAVPPATVDLTFTPILQTGPHTVTVMVIDASECSANCSSTIQVFARGDLYPIALSQKSLVGVPVGGIIKDIYNGVAQGNFGWLNWAGSPSEPTLVKSLTIPGNSSTYINPKLPSDHVVSIGDWVQGTPGVSNSDQVRRALNALEQIDITVPVWDRATGRGNNSLYHVSAFARVRITNYHLPKENRVSARFLGLISCD